MISDKVRPHNLERKAILYVRQSQHIRCCTIARAARWQYAMRTGLTALGWSEIE